jgi:hypothetical protein
MSTSCAFLGIDTSQIQLSLMLNKSCNPYPGQDLSKVLHAFSASPIELCGRDGTERLFKLTCHHCSLTTSADRVKESRTIILCLSPRASNNCGISQPSSGCRPCSPTGAFPTTSCFLALHLVAWGATRAHPYHFKKQTLCVALLALPRGGWVETWDGREYSEPVAAWQVCLHQRACFFFSF